MFKERFIKDIKNAELGRLIDEQKFPRGHTNRAHPTPAEGDINQESPVYSSFWTKRSVVPESSYLNSTSYLDTGIRRYDEEALNYNQRLLIIASHLCVYISIRNIELTLPAVFPAAV